jgi:hypothetical protein
MKKISLMLVLVMLSSIANAEKQRFNDDAFDNALKTCIAAQIKGYDKTPVSRQKKIELSADACGPQVNNFLTYCLDDMGMSSQTCVDGATYITEKEAQKFYNSKK